MKVNFFVNDLDISKVGLFFQPITKAYKMACKAIGQKQKCVEINVSFLTDKEIHKLNKEQRNIDRPTDVLSFPMLNVCGKKVCKKNFPNDYNAQTKTIFLGDVLISLETAKAQAKKFGHSLLREVVFLAVHGILHLFGFDHENEKDEKIMFSLQEFVLNKCGVRR